MRRVFSGRNKESQPISPAQQRPILLEVIVTSVHEAIEAELGGADRLELVDALEQGGFTPSLEFVESVLGAVSIPVRVMLRENASISIEPSGIERLRACAARFSGFPIDGLVTGFVTNGNADVATTLQVLAGAPSLPVTFHRAFDHVKEPIDALQQLKQVPGIDRVLTGGGEGSWNGRLMRVSEWQRAAEPQIRMIFAVGSDIARISELAHHPEISEVHVGRAARIPTATSGTVNRAQVAALKKALE